MKRRRLLQPLLPPPPLRPLLLLMAVTLGLLAQLSSVHADFVDFRTLPPWAPDSSINLNVFDNMNDASYAPGKRIWSGLVDLLSSQNTLIGEQTVLLLFGGVWQDPSEGSLPISEMYNDTWIYDLNEAIRQPRWIRLLPQTAPSPRAGHTLTALTLSDTDRLAVMLMGTEFFFTGPKITERLVTDQVWTFNLSQLFRNDQDRSTLLYFLNLGIEYTAIADLWRKVPIVGDSPYSRKWHVAGMMTLDGVQRIVVHGGAILDGSASCITQCSALNDTVILTLSGGSGSWQRGPIGPPARYGHMAVVYENKMYMTGGRNELLAATSNAYAPNFNGSIWTRPFSFDDGLWILSGDSVATLVWTNLQSLPRPPGFLPATMATAVVLNGSLYLTGGVVGSGSAAELYFTVTPETWTLDLHNVTAGFQPLHSCISLTNQLLGLACASAVVAQYTANLAQQSYQPNSSTLSILIFGGITLNSQQQIQLLDDLVIYRPGRRPEVSVLSDAAQPPPHRDGAMAAVNFDNQGPPGLANVSALMDYALYVFGGQSFVGALNNLKDLYRVGLRNGTLRWSRVALNTSHTPAGRSRHTFSAMQSTLPFAPPRYAALLFGGVTFDAVTCLDYEDYQTCSPDTSHADDKTCYMNFNPGEAGLVRSDLWLFNLSTFSWSELSGTGSSAKPQCRAHHIAAAFDTRLFIHGGYSGFAVEPFGEKVVLPPIDDMPCSNTTCQRYLLRDLWVFDWPSNSWYNIVPAPGSPVPRPRAQHAGGIVGNVNGVHGLQLVIFGGYQVGDGEKMLLTGETWMATLPPMTADLSTYQGMIYTQWTRIEQLYAPVARYGHGFTSMGMYSLLMVGGVASDGEYPRDVWEFVYALDGDTNPSVFATSPVGWYKLNGALPYGLMEFTIGSLVSKNRSAAYVFGGQIAGEYAYFSYSLIRYVPGCGAGVVYDPECRDYFLWDCPCKACPAGSYASEFDIACTACPNLGWTASTHTSSIVNCTVCNPNACNNHGSCVVQDVRLGQVACQCSFGYTEQDNCRTNILLVVVLVVYAIICITSIITSVFKRVTRNVHYLRIENKLKEGLLNETKRENLELRSFWEIDYNELTKIRNLDEGSQGVVMLCYWGDEQVAVKKLHEQLIADEATEEAFKQEMEVLCKLRHKNLILFKGACTYPSGAPGLVMEFMSRGSLFNILHDEAMPLSWSRRVAFAVDAASGMRFLHARNRVHRDLKSFNLLVASNGVVKVSDFGSATIVERNTLSGAEQRTVGESVGTPQWMAPEVWASDSCDKPVDVYSFAIVMWEILTREEPFANVQRFTIKRRVMDGDRPPIPETSPADWVSLMTTAWNGDPRLRPTFDQLLPQLEEMQRALPPCEPLGVSDQPWTLVDNTVSPA